MNFTKYRTLVNALRQLRQKGFTHSFKLDEGKLINLKTGKSYRPEDLRIVEYHRFEGDSNPAGMSVVFAVKCSDGAKGTIVSSFGTYADMPLITFLDKVKIQDRTGMTGKT